MAAGDTARLYHRLTSSRYGPGLEWPEPGRPVPVGDPRMLADFVPLDMARLPAPCKAYPPGLPVSSCRATGRRSPGSATSVLAGRHVAAPSDPDLPGLARLLHLSAGVVRVMERGDRRWLFRAAGSAGGRFPLEVYLSARGVAGLPDGVHWYDPIGHATHPGRAASGRRSDDAGRHWRPVADRLEIRRTRPPSRLLGRRHDARSDPRPGGIGRIPPAPVDALLDAEVTRLVGADGIHEFPLALVGVGHGEPVIQPSGEAPRGDRRGTDRVPARHAHAARGRRRPARRAMGCRASPARSSTRLGRSRCRHPAPGFDARMDPGASMPRAVFDWSLAASLRGSRVPHFVAVHAVEGLAPGLYRWPDLERALRRGSLRDEVFRLLRPGPVSRRLLRPMAAIDLAGLDDPATARPRSVPASSKAVFTSPRTRSDFAPAG